MSRRLRSTFDAALSETPCATPHFTADLLVEGLRSGLTQAERWRAVLHFGRLRCGECWELLQQTAERNLLPARAGPADSFDPVVMALRRLVMTYWTEASQPAGSPDLDQLRPAHTYWIGHSRIEELGFCRLSLEENRQYALAHPDSALAAARNMLDLVHSLPFADVGASYLDLEALARAYLADELRSAGDLAGAARQLAISGQELERGSGAEELRATWYELASDLAQARGQYTLALSQIAEALELSATVRIPGRWAETFVRQGLARLRCGELPAAARAFRRALDEIPPGKILRLRLEALQLLALTQLRRRRLDEATEHLAEVHSLGVEMAPPLMRAQLAWIQGMLHLEAGRTAEAEESLRDAVQRFRDLGRPVDAAQCLAALGRLYVTHRRPRDLEQLERDFLPLLETPETRRWVLAELTKVARWAEAAGMPLDSELSGAVKLADEPNIWIH